MIRQMRHHLQLDTTIRAGGHSLQERINKHGEHANSVHEQISTLHRALQSGDECEVLQLKDEIDVLYREFQLQTDSMVVMKQKMDHMNHGRKLPYEMKSKYGIVQSFLALFSALLVIHYLSDFCGGAELDTIFEKGLKAGNDSIFKRIWLPLLDKPLLSPSPPFRCPLFDACQPASLPPSHHLV